MEEYRKIHGNDERIRTAVRIYYNVVKECCEVKKSLTYEHMFTIFDYIIIFSLIQQNRQ